MLYATEISLIVLIFLLRNYYDFWANPCEYRHLLGIRKLQYAAFVSYVSQNINFPHSFHMIICRYFAGTHASIYKLHCVLHAVGTLSQSYS